MSIRGLITRFHSEGGVLSMNELMDSAEVGDFLALSPRTVRWRFIGSSWRSVLEGLQEVAGRGGKKHHKERRGPKSWGR